MTVIACDKHQIASDSLITFGNERGLRPVKKIIVEGGKIYASCGPAILPALVKWHKAEADPYHLPVVGTDPSDYWTLMVIERSGVYLYQKDAPYPQQVDPPFAIGTGADYAVGAMDHGASAEEAVAIAIRRTTTCGGPIQVENIAEALGILREAAE